MIDIHLANLLIICAFAIGYMAIIIESSININKAASALLMGVITWMFLFLIQGSDWYDNLHKLSESLGEVSQIIFFLIGAMAIVELIDSHRGFTMITDLIQTNSKRKLLWVLGFITFFLSSILDNLTTTIVMVSLLRKLVPEQEDRMLLGAMVVIAANAGGAFSPIGDVTTTMLWIKGNITTLAIIQKLFFPSLISLITALLIMGKGMKGTFPKLVKRAHEEKTEPGAKLVFFVGIGALMFVPIFKALTGLPPFMGVLIGLGILWLVTDFVHAERESRKHLKIPYILTRIDVSSVLFFLGILLCINALNTAGILANLAQILDQIVHHNVTVITTIIGLVSAVVDNVPLVAAGIGMYDLQTNPPDSPLWQLLAYCAGTGGSILIIGSAAGVAFMSLEKATFMWYLKKAGWVAFISYIAGIWIYLLQEAILHYLL